MPFYTKDKLLNSIRCLNKYTNNRLFKFGIPYILLVVGGSFGLKYFTSLRYEYSQKTVLNREEFEKRGIQMKKPGEVTLESEYEKIKDMDIDNWTNVRGPRPWEQADDQTNITKTKVKVQNNELFKSTMFDSKEEKVVEKHDINEPSLKKKKLDKLYESTLIHSSLEYKTIRAPPLVAYKSIDSYCENNYGQSYKTPSTSDLRDLQSISSPIFFKTPKKPSFKKVLHEEAMPYSLFTVEELSLVKCLKNWFNVKVSAVGHVSHDTTTQKCYLNSVRECGQWSLLLDTSLLEEIPKLEQLLQVYGTLTMNGDESCVKLCFIRRLSWVNLNLYHDSYRLMQKHIGKIECSKSGTEVQIVAKNSQHTEDFQMNDTLDDCSFLF